MERIRQLMADLICSGSVTYDHGDDVILIDPVAETKPTDYCYEFFKPLTEEALAELAAGYSGKFPKPLADFYRITNGAFMFGRHISIFGAPVWRADYKQPMSLAFSNGHRTLLCPKERLFFAAYQGEPELQIFFDTRESGDDMHVYAAYYGKNKVVAEWPSLPAWLLEERKKLAERYRTGDYKMLDIVPGVLRSISFAE